MKTIVAWKLFNGAGKKKPNPKQVVGILL